MTETLRAEFEKIAISEWRYVPGQFGRDGDEYINGFLQARWQAAQRFYRAGRESASKGEGQEWMERAAEECEASLHKAFSDIKVRNFGIIEMFHKIIAKHAPSSPGSEREAGRWVSIDEHGPCPKCHHVHPVGAVTLAYAYTRCTYSGPGPMETCNCNVPIDDFVNEEGI